MAEWEPGLPLPAQIADAFAAMYDWFDLFHATEPLKSRWKTWVKRQLDLDDLTAAVRATDWKTPRFLQAVIDDALSAGVTKTSLAVFGCLSAIDQGLKQIHPDETPTGRLWLQYVKHGHYNDASSGYVLPSRTSTNRGDHLSDQFSNLIRANVHREHVRLIRSPERTPALQFHDGPKVVVAPFLYQLERFSGTPVDDLRFRARTKAGEDFFEVRHLDGGPGSTVDLRARVRRIVGAIRDKGAAIAVIPELALDHALFGELRDALRDTADEDSPLVWVIAGYIAPRPPVTGEVPVDFPVSNAAAVLDQYGNVVVGRFGGRAVDWIQRKRHRYTLTSVEQHRYEIGHLFPCRADRREAVTPGTEVLVFEALAGRYAVMICEDFGQEEHTCAELRHMGCSLLVVILMDGPMVSSRWAPAKARAVVDQTGSRVAVANSLAVSLLPANLRYEQKLKRGKTPVVPATRDVGYLVHADGATRMLPAPSVPGSTASCLISAAGMLSERAP